MKTFLIALLMAVAASRVCGQSLSPASATAVGVAVTINPPTIAAGQTASLVAQLQMSDGTLGARVTNQCAWTTQTASVATVSGSTVTALTAGSSLLSCTVGAFNGALGLTGSATITVTASPLITNPAAGCSTPCALPAATNGTAYSFTFMATGGTLPYTWTNNVGTPPTGLTLSSAGVLSGTPTVNGTTTWTVKVTDAVPNNATLQVSLTVNASAGCGTPPNYCARQDTAVSSGATDNGGKPPAALMGLNCASAGNCGTTDCVLDANNSGPAQAYICRISDFTMAGAGNVIQVNSSSTTRQWSTDSLLYEANVNGNTAWWLLAAGSPPTIHIKGNASNATGGLSFNVGPPFSGNPCTVPLCGTAASTSYLFYGAGATTGFPARNTINKYVLDTTNAAWTGSIGAAQDLTAAITGTVLLDPINCPGLTTYMTGSQEGPYWNRWMAAVTADQSVDKLDHVSGAGYRYSQDNGSLIILYDASQSSGAKCRWLDTKTGQVGGSYGPTGATTGFGPLPPPVAPTVSMPATGGSLDCTQQYAVWQTYVVEGKSGAGGESTQGARTVVGPNGSGSACSLAVSAPVANPGGGSGLNLIMTATGYNNYACVWVNSLCAFQTVPNLQNNASWQSAGQRGPDFVNCSPSPCRNITFSFTQAQSTPSLSGSSMRFDVGGTVGYGDAFFNNHLIGDQSSIGLPDTNRTFVPTLHNFTYDVYFYGTNLALSQALEFDVNQFFSSMGFIWGFQCQIAGVPQNFWYIWDNVNGTWVLTSATCNPVSNQWNHLRLTVQRTPTNNLLYQTISLNGLTQTLNQTYPHGTAPSNFYGVTINYQQDGNSVQDPYTIYLDNLIFGYGQ